MLGYLQRASGASLKHSEIYLPVCPHANMQHVQPGSCQPNLLHMIYALKYICHWNGAGLLTEPKWHSPVLPWAPAWPALTAEPQPQVCSSQNGYSQGFYNHRNNLHCRILWLFLNSVMNQVKQFFQDWKRCSRGKKKSQSGVKVLLYGSKGQFFP